MFIGQESNGWESFGATLNKFSNNRLSKDEQREAIFDYLQWMYEDFRFRRRSDNTPYWRGMRQLYQAVAPNQGDDGFLNTQLGRFDFDRKRVPTHLEDVLDREFNILEMEIQALQPDVIIFLTGPDYDDRLRKIFKDLYRSGDNLRMEPIANMPFNSLARIEHPYLPKHTYRTYHPGYSIRKHNTVFTPIEQALSRLCNN